MIQPTLSFELGIMKDDSGVIELHFADGEVMHFAPGDLLYDKFNLIYQALAQEAEDHNQGV
jgi:hypothetical protein